MSAPNAWHRWPPWARRPRRRPPAPRLHHFVRAGLFGVPLAGLLAVSCQPTPPATPVTTSTVLPAPTPGGAPGGTSASPDAPDATTASAGAAPAASASAVPATSASPAASVRPPGDRTALAPLQCAITPERPDTPPPESGHHECAYYRACPDQPRGPRIRRCSPRLKPVDVRDLRAEHRSRAVGSPIAVRGVTVMATPRVLSSDETPAAGFGNGRCLPIASALTLAADSPGACLAVNLSGPDSLRCHGDVTDRCCHENPALPKQGTVAVAVGMYLGTSPVWPDGEVDDIAVDYFCTLSAPPGGTHQP